MEFPDSEEFQSLVLGALSLLADEQNYEEFGALSSLATSDAFRQTLFSFMEFDCVIVPVGSCMDFAGDVIPDGWLDTNQGAVSRTVYSRLFEVIGTQFGSGDGSTTFDLPHKDGRVTIGLKPGDADFNSLGETGGSKAHTLTTAELPAHTHSIFADASMGAGATARRVIGVSGASNVTSGSTGGGGSHPNVQPYVVLNYIIKY